MPTHLQCRDCGGSELYNTVLSARNGVIIGRKLATGDEWIMVRCLICLACGTVMPYLDDAGLDRLRVWAQALPPAGGEPAAVQQQQPAQSASVAPGQAPVQNDPANPTPVHETGGAGFGTIVIFCLILGALLGIVVAVYGIMHQ